MKQDIVVPSLGESVTQGLLVQWLKKNGDFVENGEEIFELETDKALVSVPSPFSGVLKILVEEGTEVSVDQIVGTIETNGQPETMVEPARTTEKMKPAVIENLETMEERLLSPAVRRMVEEYHLEPHDIAGTGKDGRITKADVVTFMEVEKDKDLSGKTGQVQPGKEEQPAHDQVQLKEEAITRKPSPIEPSVSPFSQSKIQDKERQTRAKMSTIRRRIAERLVQAQQESAYLTTFNEINMAQVIALRQRNKVMFEKKHGVKLGFMSFFVKACCSALASFPAVNALVDGDEIVYNNYYDIGIAVSTERGLVVPVIKDANLSSLPDLEKQVADFAQRAREKKLTLDELTGGTFSISNGGVFGSLLSTPIPNPPQTAILGMHTIQKRPVVVNDEIVIQPMMYVAVSYDHRLIDGQQAVSFLKHIKELIEEPERMWFDI